MSIANMSHAEQELLCSGKMNHTTEQTLLKANELTQMAQKLNMNMDDETTEILIEEMKKLYVNDPKMWS